VAVEMPPAVRLHRAVALLGRFPALAGVDREVEQGEVVHLSGPNGAGKSTLLRVCAGLVPIVQGEGEVLGHDVRRDRRSVRRRVGLLGHATSLYDELTVEDNVRFAVRAAGGPVGAVAPALARVAMDGRLAAVEVGRLSAGQRRRAALAILVARAPELWLLDEPHAGLDVAGRALVDELVAEAAAGGRTVLLASHELDRAASLAGRTLTLVAGQVRSDRPGEVTAVVEAGVGSAP
jgi:heme ABC exporter ATP-binding subunit CcmA